MFGAILKATNSSFQKGMAFCRSIYVKKVMKLLAFIFEQPSYLCYCGYIVVPTIVCGLFVGPLFCNVVSLFGPRREKTCLRGFRNSETQITLLSYRDYLEN